MRQMATGPCGEIAVVPRPLACLALLVVAGCPARRPPDNRPPPAASDVWIRDVTVVSAERPTPLSHAHVLIRGGRITWVGTRPPDGAPRAARIIEGAGKYLVPGLIDGHVHLGEVPGLTREQASAHPELVERYFRQLPRSYLYFGFTAVVDLNVIDRRRVDGIRAAAVGPAVFDCGNALALANGYPMHFAPSPERFAQYPNFLYDPRQSASIPPGYPAAEHTPAAAVARVAGGGGICVKAAFEPGFGPDRGKLPTPTEEMIRQAHTASHQHHLPLLLHANSLTAHRFAVAIPVDAIVHGLWNWEVADPREGALPPEVQRVLDDERKAGIAGMATLRVMGGLADLFSPTFLDDVHLGQVLPAGLVAWYRGEGRWFADELRGGQSVPDHQLRGRFEQARGGAAAAIRAFAASGGRLLFGSDTPSGPLYTNPPGYNGYLELLALERAGIPPRRILTAATASNAQFFNLTDLGTIEPGKRASLLLLRADPDTSMSALDTIDLVIQGSHVLPRPSLAVEGSAPPPQ
jgi:imidazolonepropionase-like amidohydrolase